MGDMDKYPQFSEKWAGKKVSYTKYPMEFAERLTHSEPFKADSGEEGEHASMSKAQ
jgi:hypothetical protein